MSIDTTKNEVKMLDDTLPLVMRFSSNRCRFVFLFSVTDRSGASIATVVYNPQHNPYMLEELPPSYDSLEEIKKHFHQTTTNNQTVENPTAPTPPPPSYRELLDNVNNK